MNNNALPESGSGIRSSAENTHTGGDVNITYPDLREEMLAAFRLYIEAYFTERDLEKTLAMFHRSVSGFGTGEDEFAFDIDAFRVLYARDLSQAPNPLQLQFHYLNAELINEAAGVVSAVISISTLIDNSPIIFEGLRLSVVLGKTNNTWDVRHMHISLPTRTQEEGESYPLKELHRRNLWLEQTIKEKTNELTEINKKLEADIAKRKKIEKTLKESETQLKETVAAKDKFFSIIAHDMKSPFVGLIGASHILQEDYEKLSENERHIYINAITERIDGAYKLLQNLLEWSRIQTGRMPFQPELISIRSDFTPTFELLKKLAEEKNISFEYELPENETLTADKNMLFSVFRNLISNAIKFTYPGGKITFACDVKSEAVTFTVADNGVGMDRATLSDLFSPGGVRSTIGTAEEKGTGIGLLLCKEFIDMHGGNIEVKSKPGKGTSFIVRLPLISEL